MTAIRLILIRLGLTGPRQVLQEPLRVAADAGSVQGSSGEIAEGTRGCRTRARQTRQGS